MTKRPQKNDIILYEGTYYTILDIRPPVTNKGEVTHYRYQGATLVGSVHELDIPAEYFDE